MEDRTSLICAELFETVEVKPQPWRKALKAWNDYSRQINNPISLPKLKFLDNAGTNK